VTTQQANLLDLALAETETLDHPIVEVGSYRGVSTLRFAQATRRTIYAVDPFMGYGGSVRDLAAFETRVQTVPNVHHLRVTSGEASRQLQTKQMSFVFIDAVHDFANTWFDYCAWHSLLAPGGLIALHDVDDFSGSNLACRKVMSLADGPTVWGYCPNLIVFHRSF
jgi:predicted O-methyltransferase YrrM